MAYLHSTIAHLKEYCSLSAIDTDGLLNCVPVPLNTNPQEHTIPPSSNNARFSPSTSIPNSNLKLYPNTLEN